MDQNQEIININQEKRINYGEKWEKNKKWIKIDKKNELTKIKKWWIKVNKLWMKIDKNE